ncbi:unannotated protein [freshwater metagenome]|uniref:Unannotated protein n=1 Tax=freshwater metagenome TaxID=449393 RepID=A0A6J7D544_9ZZZZ
MHVCIFCSSSDLPEEFVAHAREVAAGIAAGGHHLVWGGQNVGLMEVVATAVRDGGGRIIAVSLDVYTEWDHPSPDEYQVFSSLGDRKESLLARSDAIVVLAGGLGTFDELTEVIELGRQGHHDKPILVLNTAGFYDGLQLQLSRMHEEGVIASSPDELVRFASDPGEIIALLDAHAAGS